MRISDWSSDVCSSDLYRYNLPILLLAASTLVLGACATRGAPAPVISLDPPAEVMTAATLTLPPAGPVEIVVIPEPLPLPGQLMTVDDHQPAVARPPESADPVARVSAAVASARVQPARDGFVNAVPQIGREHV